MRSHKETGLAHTTARSKPKSFDRSTATIYRPASQLAAKWECGHIIHFILQSSQSIALNIITISCLPTNRIERPTQKQQQE
eukprot:scaffold6446_cov131-Skeletonema_marinoi.AAC.2